jgi:hypothetical protein
MRILQLASRSLAILGVVGVSLSTLSCSRGDGGDGAEEIYVTNKTDKNLWCDLTIDGRAIPAGTFGPGGRSTALLPSKSGEKLARFHVVDSDHKGVTADIDIDLTKVSGKGEDLHFEIMSMTEVKAYYAHEDK